MLSADWPVHRRDFYESEIHTKPYLTKMLDYAREISDAQHRNQEAKWSKLQQSHDGEIDFRHPDGSHAKIKMNNYFSSAGNPMTRLELNTYGIREPLIAHFHPTKAQGVINQLLATGKAGDKNAFHEHKKTLLDLLSHHAQDKADPSPYAKEFHELLGDPSRLTHEFKFTHEGQSHHLITDGENHYMCVERPKEDGLPDKFYSKLRSVEDVQKVITDAFSGKGGKTKMSRKAKSFLSAIKNSRKGKPTKKERSEEELQQMVHHDVPHHALGDWLEEGNHPAAHVVMNHSDEAERAYQENMSQGQPIPHNNGVIHFKSLKNNQFILSSALKPLLRSNPEYRSVFPLFHYSFADYDQLQSILERAERSNPDLVTRHPEHNSDGAVAYYYKNIDQQPNSPLDDLFGSDEDQTNTRMSRKGKPKKKSREAEEAIRHLLPSVQANPHDHGARGALADALEESGNYHDEDTLYHLRNHENPVYSFTHPATGRVVASPNRRWLIGEFLRHHFEQGDLQSNEVNNPQSDPNHYFDGFYSNNLDSNKLLSSFFSQIGMPNHSNAIANRSTHGFIRPVTREFVNQHFFRAPGNGIRNIASNIVSRGENPISLYWSSSAEVPNHEILAQEHAALDQDPEGIVPENRSVAPFPMKEPEKMSRSATRKFRRILTLLRKFQKANEASVRFLNEEKKSWLRGLAGVLHKLDSAAKQVVEKKIGGSSSDRLVADKYQKLAAAIHDVKKGDFTKIKSINTLLSNLGQQDATFKHEGKDHNLVDYLTKAESRLGHLNMKGEPKKVDEKVPYIKTKPENREAVRSGLKPEEPSKRAFTEKTISPDQKKALLEESVRKQHYFESDPSKPSQGGKVARTDKPKMVREKVKGKDGKEKEVVTKNPVVPRFPAGSLYSGTQYEKFLQKLYQQYASEARKLSDQRREVEMPSEELPIPNHERRNRIVTNMRNSIQSLMNGKNPVQSARAIHNAINEEQPILRRTGNPEESFAKIPTPLGHVKEPGEKSPYHLFDMPMSKFYNFDTMAHHKTLDEEIHKLMSSRNFDWKKMKAYMAKTAPEEGLQYHHGIALVGPAKDHRNYEAVHQWLSHERPKSYSDHWDQIDPHRKKFTDFMASLISPELHEHFKDHPKLQGGIDHRKITESIGRVAKALYEKSDDYPHKNEQFYQPELYKKDHPYKMSRKQKKRFEYLLAKFARATKSDGIAFKADGTDPVQHAQKYAEERSNFKKALTKLGLDTKDPFSNHIVNHEFDNVKEFFNNNQGFDVHPAAVNYSMVMAGNHHPQAKLEAAMNLIGTSRSMRGLSPDLKGEHKPFDQPKEGFYDYVLGNSRGEPQRIDPEVTHDFIKQSIANQHSHDKIIADLTGAGYPLAQAEDLIKHHHQRNRWNPANAEFYKANYGNPNDHSTVAHKVINEMDFDKIPPTQPHHFMVDPGIEQKAIRRIMDVIPNMGYKEAEKLYRESVFQKFGHDDLGNSMILRGLGSSAKPDSESQTSAIADRRFSPAPERKEDYLGREAKDNVAAGESMFDLTGGKNTERLVNALKTRFKLEDPESIRKAQEILAFDQQGGGKPADKKKPLTSKELDSNFRPGVKPDQVAKEMLDSGTSLDAIQNYLEQRYGIKSPKLLQKITKDQTNRSKNHLDVLKQAEAMRRLGNYDDETVAKIISKDYDLTPEEAIKVVDQSKAYSNLKGKNKDTFRERGASGENEDPIDLAQLEDRYQEDPNDQPLALDDDSTPLALDDYEGSDTPVQRKTYTPERRESTPISKTAGSLLAKAMKQLQQEKESARRKK